MSDRPTSRRAPYFLLALLATSLVLGCGSGGTLVPVDGTVLLDNQPLPDVLITFVPEAAGTGTPIRSMGISDASGNFRLKAETLSPGASPGVHRVIVEDLAILDAPRSEDGTVISLPTKRFPSVYSDPLRTPLRAIIKAESEPISLELSGRP